MESFRYSKLNLTMFYLIVFARYPEIEVFNLKLSCRWYSLQWSHKKKNVYLILTVKQYCSSELRLRDLHLLPFWYASENFTFDL